MTRDEMIQALQNIGTCEDDVQRRGLLADLQTSLESDYDSFEKTTTENETYKNDNEMLRSANMKLFLQVGGKRSEDVLPTGEDKPKERLKFEDLFNEKGGLK